MRNTTVYKNRRDWQFILSELGRARRIRKRAERRAEQLASLLIKWRQYSTTVERCHPLATARGFGAAS